MDHRYQKFLAIAETGSFSAAAKSLRISQPAITLAIASLERSLATKLYIRKKYTVELTENGHLVAETARKLSLEIQKMHDKLARQSQQYRVGIIDSITHLLYESPGDDTLFGNLEVMVDNSRNIIASLLSSNIDAGLITGQPRALSKGLRVQKLHQEQFVFVQAPEHKATYTGNTIDDWLAFNQDSTSYEHFTKLFRKQGLKVTPIFYSASMELLKSRAIAGTGTALLPWHIVEHAVASGTLKVLETDRPLTRPIWAIMRSEHQPSLIKRLTAHIDTLLA